MQVNGSGFDSTKHKKTKCVLLSPKWMLLSWTTIFCEIRQRLRLSSKEISRLNSKRSNTKTRTTLYIDALPWRDVTHKTTCKVQIVYLLQLTVWIYHSSLGLLDARHDNSDKMYKGNSLPSRLNLRGWNDALGVFIDFLASFLIWIRIFLLVWWKWFVFLIDMWTCFLLSRYGQIHLTGERMTTQLKHAEIWRCP